nr:capsid protein [Eimeria necatrix RNA virus 1]
MDASRTTACLLAQIVPGSLLAETPPFGQYRKYVSRIEMRANVRSIPQVAYCPLQYEVGPAFDIGADARRFRRSAWMDHVFRDGPLLGGKYETPEEVRKVLKEEKFRQVCQADWPSFNFDGIVCVLGAVGAAMSLVPDLSTREWRDANPAVRGLVATEDMHAANSGGVVYYDPMALSVSSECAKWLLVYAANLCGSTVVMPHVSLDVNGRVICKDYDGPELRRGLTFLINMLGTYYSMASRGDVYVLALMTGIHRVLTVVGHSDEGGWFRDILRQGRWVAPHGGIPRLVPLSSGISVDNGRFFGNFVALIDSIALGTAAVVAHCDPLVCTNGDMYPTMFTVDAPESCASASEAAVACQTLMARAIADGSTQFFVNYAQASATLFRLHADLNLLAAAGMLQEMADYFSLTGSRHTALAVASPFFWIEPTSIIPVHEFGLPAELFGYASLTDAVRSRSIPFFEALEPEALSDGMISHWRAKIRSPRTCGYALYAAAHTKNGLANVLLRGFNSSAIALAAISPEQIRCTKADKGYVTLNQLMWKRGQSKLPHPAEALNVDGTYSISILHSAVSTRHYQKPIEHIPPPEDMPYTSLELRCTRLCYYKLGPANSEPSGALRLRNMGVDALNDMVGVVAQSLQRGACFPPPSETAPLLRSAIHHSGGEAIHVSAGPPGFSLGACSKDNEPTLATGRPVGVTFTHAAMPYPQPQRGVDTGTRAAPPTTGPAAAGDEHSGAAGAVTSPAGTDAHVAAAEQQ